MMRRFEIFNTTTVMQHSGRYPSAEGIRQDCNNAGPAVPRHASIAAAVQVRRELFQKTFSAIPFTDEVQ